MALGEKHSVVFSCSRMDASSSGVSVPCSICIPHFFIGKLYFFLTSTSLEFASLSISSDKSRSILASSSFFFENAVAAIAKGSVGDMVLYAKWSEKDMAVYKINNYEKGNVSVRKRTDTDDSSSVVIVAFYKTLNNNSVLIKTSIAEIGAIEKGDDISKTVEEPEDYSYAKVFMWNDLNGMMPRCNSPKMDK